MGINVKESEVKVFKKENGYTFCYISNNDTNRETGEIEKQFSKIKINFKKGVEVKNKTKINIKNGFLTFDRVETEELKRDGSHLKRDFYKIQVMEFDVIEEGVDEFYQDTKFKPKEISNDTFSFDMDIPDSLPF